MNRVDMMKKIITGVVVLMLTAVVCCWAEARAADALPQSGSFEFDNIPVAKALRTIGQDTGIEIKAPFEELRETVQKSYENVPVDEIIQDLMKRQNYAIIWHYLDQALVAVDIRIDDGGNGRSNTGVTVGNKRSAITKANRRAPSSRARQYNPADRSRPQSPPAPDPERSRGVRPPPMPPNLPF